MKRLKLGHCIALVALAAGLMSVAPERAAAQGFFDSLFGGGGFSRSGRQMVSFTRQYRAGTIIVSFADRRLYYITRAGEAISYPIGVPTGKASWAGTSHVSSKRVNPDWTPTPEMRRENPELPAYVPGGHPRNPLGVRALYLGDTLYRIHGTDAPWTIGQQVSHGCIRLYNDDVIDLYNRVRVGAQVIVTWKRFMS
jgi:lipoprotein-anchoring transpeptidase ErfK/SrfK